MRLRERVRALEGELGVHEAYRLLFVDNGADQEAEMARYREQTGYMGPIICIDEADAKL